MLPVLIFLVAFFCSVDGAVNVTWTCPPGSIPPTHAADHSLCYMFVNLSKSFDDAEAYCRQQNGHLTTVNDFFTDIFLVDQGLTFFPSAASFWIGARVVNYTTNIWLWTKNNGFLTFTDWKNPADGATPTLGKCAAVTVADLTWSAVSCSQSLPFVCEIPGVVPVMGHTCDSGYTHYNETNMCYKRFGYPESPDLHSFNESESICQADGGHLVSIHSDAENTFVSSLAPGRVHNDSMNLWIGASSNADIQYAWTDGTPFDYSNWDLYGEHPSTCTVLWSDGVGSWKMKWAGYYACPEHLGRFICKKPPAPATKVYFLILMLRRH